MLHELAGQGDTEALSALLAQGADVNAKDDEGATALHFAGLCSCMIMWHTVSCFLQPPVPLCTSPVGPLRAARIPVLGHLLPCLHGSPCFLMHSHCSLQRTGVRLLSHSSCCRQGQTPTHRMGMARPRCTTLPCVGMRR